MAEILGQELELPNIENKGKQILEKESVKYSGIKRHGPNSLHVFRRTFKEALKREISSGNYDIENPVVVPIKEDKRYRSYKTIQQKSANAAIIYMMDVSGSMGDEQKECAANKLGRGLESI